jgi:beta-galactosidase
MDGSERFLWGVSISGFQFEMGGPGTLDPNTDWYRWVHDAGNIRTGLVSGDQPDDGVGYWTHYAADHRLAKKLGLNAVRMGLEWSRIFPQTTAQIDVGVERADDGTISRIDVDAATIERLDRHAQRDAVRHYRDVLLDLRRHGFTVLVCLNHFTLPLWIHAPLRVRATRMRRGPKGWLAQATIVEFTKYAAYVAATLGDLVDRWFTLNEPMIVAEMGYLVSPFHTSCFPPKVLNVAAAKTVTFNQAVAHARAYDAIKRWDRDRADAGSASPADVGVIQHVTPVQPFDATRRSDVRAARFVTHLHNHLFLAAVTDGWLDANLNGAQEPDERQPSLQRRLDHLGVNYYARSVLRGRSPLLAKLLRVPVLPEPVRGFGMNCPPRGQSRDGHPTSDFGWEIYPQGIEDALDMMRRYAVPLYVTENGVADERDAHRSQFIAEHVAALGRARRATPLDLRGYFHWSLLDNYEWAEGYRQHFGLVAVDRATKARRPRPSAMAYQALVAAHRTGPR